MKGILIGVLLLCVCLLALWGINHRMIGTAIDEHNGVAVYYNGWDTATSYGKHFDANGYYFGHKWQCVEFVKRYYYLHLNHAMPDGWGHAKDFFDTGLPHGGYNKRRGLYQYFNAHNDNPKPDDLLVYNKGRYGHVAIVSAVGRDYVEIVQQNVFLKTRKRLSLKNGKVGEGSSAPIGWLRLNSL